MARDGDHNLVFSVAKDGDHYLDFSVAKDRDYNFVTNICFYILFDLCWI